MNAMAAVRTGVDFQVFSKNRMSNKKLTTKDKDVFPEGKERFSLSKKDSDKDLYHAHVKTSQKKKKK